MGADKVGAIVVAAGESRRMDGTDKIFAELGGKPLLARILDTLERCDSVDEIVMVLSEQNLPRGSRLLQQYGWRKVSALHFPISRPTAATSRFPIFH